MKIPKLFFLVVLISFTSCDKEQEEENSSLSIKSSAPIYLGEPISNAGTTLITDNDGSIKFIFRKGDWDYGGFSDTVFYMTTYDEGRTWSDPEILGNTGKGSQCFSTISPISGEVMIFFIRRQPGIVGNIMLARSKNDRKNWSDIRLFDKFQFGGIGYGNCLWIDLLNGKKRVLCGFHGTDGQGAGVYYSDDDGVTWGRSNRIFVPNLIPNIWHTGSVEPSFIELNDSRIWMLMRNSNDRLWESFSNDNGETWSAAKPGRFYCGPNSWVTLKKLSSGEILLIWNNAMCIEPGVTQDRWNFTNREVLHAAISPDDGKSWFGFRELVLDRLRDSTFVNHPGDKGLNESKVVETTEGNVLIACGQAPGHRAFLLLDPKWLYETERSDDFSEGLKSWSRQKLLVREPVYKRLYHYNYDRIKGAVLVDHPQAEGKKVLHIRRPENNLVYAERDGAVWNFPAGQSGRFETGIYLNKNFKGGLIALTDRWFQPGDSQGENSAMYLVQIEPDGKIGQNINLEKEKWYNLKFRWENVKNQTDFCSIYINDVLQSEKLPLRNSSVNGISYVRFRSGAVRPDNAGFYVEYVKARTKPLE